MAIACFEGFGTRRVLAEYLGQEHVLHVGDHAARPGSVTGEGAVHHGEHAPVDLLLDQPEVHQRLVDDRMGPMPVLVEQPAEGVLHRSRRGRESVRLDGRQVDDVLPDEAPGNAETLGEDPIETQELPGEVTHRVPDVDPFLALVQVHVP
jgi:hypothetical protein